jgi:uncharacterized membrane protein YphA (DoxX/SURF4 family)
VPLRSIRRTRRFWLKRLFSAYPGGLAGIGLVLLRSVIGFTAVSQGILCLATKDTAATVRVVGGLAVLTGILLVAGFRTRLASFLIALGIAFISLCTFPLPTRDLFDRLLPTLFAETMSMAVVFLGPGAFSIDAYIYGRKEIIIPYRSRE